MTQAKLLAALDALRGEIRDLQNEDPEKSRELGLLLDRMQAQLIDVDIAERASVEAGIAGFIEAYETDHPRLTAAAGQLMNMLMNMGI